MSLTLPGHPGSPAARQAVLATIRVAAAGLAAVAGGLALQLWRHDALLGGQVARAAIPRSERAWRWPHFVANGVSQVGGTAITPMLLLLLAAAVAVRVRRWWPLLAAGAAVFAVGGFLAVGKGLAGGEAFSGPATTTVVCWAVAGWLLRDQLGRVTLRALHLLAGAAAVTIGVAQLYLRHSLPALAASWLLALLVIGLLAAGAAVVNRQPWRAGPIRGRA